jgi:hypothetical protein
MSIDERIEALTMNLELAHQEILDLKVIAAQDGEKIQQLHTLAAQDGENIRGLARIAEIHERRLTTLEGGDKN